MSLGYARPLQATDLWHVDPSREASLLSKNLDESWLRRQRTADAYNARLLLGEIKPPLKLRLRWVFSKKDDRATQQDEWRKGWGRKRPNLGFAIVEQFRVFYLSAIVFKIFGDGTSCVDHASADLARVTLILRRQRQSLVRSMPSACQLTSPLLAKAIIRYAQSKRTAQDSNQPEPSTGEGVGLAIGMVSGGFYFTYQSSSFAH